MKIVHLDELFSMLLSQLERTRNLPRMSNNSCALPRAKTGIKTLPPRLIVSCTVPVDAKQVKIYRMKLQMSLFHRMFDAEAKNEVLISENS